ncbi:hypothetical protein PI124_g15863 [Phytophthora idaei]|nr:hypothetical protein PI125_g17816 [Phytophthora idaei]KAG3139124.1 hypothetical protein PI126_g16612 [Phytophthora idaei]KAG3239187.1 hypothetical protein PI124_g15863 [Phytophthora idaei]
MPMIGKRRLQSEEPEASAAGRIDESDESEEEAQATIQPEEDEELGVPGAMRVDTPSFLHKPFKMWEQFEARF